MKKSILLTAIISLFLVLSCTSLTALGDETVAPASEGDSPDLKIKILKCIHEGGFKPKYNYYYTITVEIYNNGTSAADGEKLEFEVMVFSEINENVSMIVFKETFDLTEELPL